ncbi:hypothetical protein CCR75_002568 [Bremia lactucae]|uniref:Uncharacterized protein n=1 Tax=Bremia lactucae TaxID=4779 RepID=A0A976FMA8_BRELC|nr:hypothetical protein CCR75_002568 [Bremia lactucae]
MSGSLLQVTSSSFFRLECDHEQLFQSEYKRSNRTKGLKILRCFPHCCPDHIDRSYCGASLSVRIQLAIHLVGNAPAEFQPSKALAVFARFEAVSDVSLCTGECVEVDMMQQSVQTEINLDGQWIAGVMERPSAIVVPLRDLDAQPSEVKSLVYHLNSKAIPRWYYDWESGANKAQRLMKHTLKAYVMERVAVDRDDNFTTCASPKALTQLFKVLHVVSSTEFTVISYRRAPLDASHTPAHLVKAERLQLLRDGSVSPSGNGAMDTTHQINRPKTYPLVSDERSRPITHHPDNVIADRKQEGSIIGKKYRHDSKHCRLLWTRSDNTDSVHPLKDQLLWAHSNALAVVASKNMALLLAFACWVPIRLYAPFVDELVDAIRIKFLNKVTFNSLNERRNDCFTRLLLHHSSIAEHGHAARGKTLPFEPEDLLRLASRTVFWLFSRDTRHWMRTFFCSNSSRVLDKKAMRLCYIQFLQEMEKQLNAVVLAASSFRNLSLITEQIIAAVYRHKCLHSRRPQVRQILTGHEFAGWTMFVAQLRDTYINAAPFQLNERIANFRTAFPPHNALECDLNGEWLLDTDETECNFNEAMSATSRTMDPNSHVPPMSLMSLVDILSQIIRLEIAIDIQENSLRVRAPNGVAGSLDCMHLVLDGKARVYRMLPSGLSTCAGVGVLGDYFGEMRVDDPNQLVILLELFYWSLDDGNPSFHVRMCIEGSRNGQLTGTGDILATTGLNLFSADEIPHVREMSLRAKRELVDTAIARRHHGVTPPKDTHIMPWDEYGRFRLCYHK